MQPGGLSTTSNKDCQVFGASETLEVRQELGTYRIPRKAVSRTSDELRVASSSSLHLFHSASATTHDSLTSSQASLPSVLAPSSNAPALATRSPLGPRPLTSQVQTKRKSLPNSGTVFRSTNGTERKPAKANPRANGPRTNDIPRGFNTLPTLEISKTEKPCSITLIRRDPASGSQWNVGKISSQPISGMTLSAVGNSSWSQKMSSVWLHISNPGYDQFQGGETKYHGGEHGAIMSQAEPTIPQTGFYRQISMELSSFWDRNFKQRLRGLSDSSSLRKGTWARNSMDTTSDQFQGVYQHQSPSQDKGQKHQRCFFLSPWNGKCEFSTGPSGRSLKCKHIPPGTGLQLKKLSAEISELRFNLPSASISNSSATPPNTNQTARGSAGAKLANLRNKGLEASPQLPPTSYAAVYPSDDDSESGGHLDLTLGRERAGGGSRGERVKLGKLIIHDEGLNMIDLVVAANMGIWWRIWEKRSVLPTMPKAPLT